MSDVENLRAQGLTVETVGEILENGAKTPPPGIFAPARLDAAPSLPEPGIYFGMDDETYHSLPALSASGVKSFAASPMLYWARMSWLNPEKAEQQEEAEAKKDHLPIGKAYHCRILEGHEAFAARFIAEPAFEYGEGAIEGTDEIKTAIAKLDAKPVTRVETGEMIPDTRKGKEGEMVAATRAAVKADWIAQLQALDPSVKIKEVLKADFDREFEEHHKGKTRLPAKVIRRIEIAAAMIEKDPGIAPHMKGGQPEVTLIAYDPETGVPLKARVDKMKVTAMLDLKTLANQQERSVREACRWAIAGNKYAIAPNFYTRVADLVRQMVREHGASVVHSADMLIPSEQYTDTSDKEFQDRHAERVAFALKWASHRLPDKFGFVFQQKGMAPVTRLLWHPVGGTHNAIIGDIVSRVIRDFRTCSETFGCDPWLDIAEPEQLTDEDLPNSASEI